MATSACKAKPYPVSRGRVARASSVRPAQAGRFARQQLDAGPVAGGELVGGGEPGAAHAKHVRQGEEVGRAAQADAAGGAEADLRQRAGPGAEQLEAAGRHRGEEL